jgi:hypothetical protein
MALEPCIRRITDSRAHPCFNLLWRSNWKIRKSLAQSTRRQQYLIIRYRLIGQTQAHKFSSW